jgi:hypothetical protein
MPGNERKAHTSSTSTSWWACLQGHMPTSRCPGDTFVALWADTMNATRLGAESTEPGELFAEGNLDAADELIHADFINHELPPGNPQGPEGLKQTVSWLRGLWGDMRAEIKDEICEGATSAASWSSSACATECRPSCSPTSTASTSLATLAERARRRSWFARASGH